uniref:Peptidase M14 domain-containing protein n=1 Tax=Anopheles farauti TaxID=69004 RepID=A0A182QZF2_9DIPT
MLALELLLLLVATVNADVHDTPGVNASHLRQAGSGVNEFNPLDFFLSYEETNEWMVALVKQYPHICKMESVGKSYEGRAINAITINYDKPTKVILVANLKAREWTAMTSAIYIIHELVIEASVYPEAGQFRWMIIPIPNPDGYEHTRLKERLWRKTRSPQANTGIGVDLSHNFGYMWDLLLVPGDENPKAETYRGPNAFSEPESQAIGNVLKSNADATLYVDMQTYGEHILIPWAYTNEPAPNAALARAVAKAGSDAIFREFYQYGTPAELINKEAGSSMDYCNSIGIKVCITLELTAAGYEIPTDDIVPYGKEALASIQAMAIEAQRN